MKNKLINFLIATALSLLFSINAYAQYDKPPEVLAKISSEKVVKELKLNSEQSKKAYEITLKYVKLNLALKESDYGKLKKYQKFKTNSKNRAKEMEKILNEDQFKKYEKMMAEEDKKVIKDHE